MHNVSNFLSFDTVMWPVQLETNKMVGNVVLQSCLLSRSIASLTITVTSYGLRVAFLNKRSAEATQDEASSVFTHAQCRDGTVFQTFRRGRARFGKRQCRRRAFRKTNTRVFRCIRVNADVARCSSCLVARFIRRNGVQDLIPLLSFPAPVWLSRVLAWEHVWSKEVKLRNQLSEIKCV